MDTSTSAWREASELSRSLSWPGQIVACCATGVQRAEPGPYAAGTTLRPFMPVPLPERRQLAVESLESGGGGGGPIALHRAEELTNKSANSSPRSLLLERHSCSIGRHNYRHGKRK